MVKCFSYGCGCILLSACVFQRFRPSKFGDFGTSCHRSSIGPIGIIF